MHFEIAPLRGTPLLNAPENQVLGSVQEALKQIWGYEQFRPHQAETISAVLAKRDSMTVLPTGGGKSLCYQLPASLLPGTAIIISPLIALMADQVQGLQVLGVPCAFLNSSMTAEEAYQAKADLFSGRLKLLFVSPERMMQMQFLQELQRVTLSFIAVDEAHCISQWGHDFRPEYQQLHRLKETFPGVSIHAFTATAPPRVQQEIIQSLRLQKAEVRIGNYFRRNLFYKSMRRQKVKQQVLDLVREVGRGESCIVYCLTRKETEALAAHLSDHGFRALAYHAGMDSEQRASHQEAFSQEKASIMVATVAFGMGIDQSNVRLVLHVGMPRSLSHYQQESGRAGRDGLPAQCTLLYSNQDILFWKRIIDDEGVLPEVKNQQLAEMIQFATMPKCRHATLVTHFGQEFTEIPCKACDVCTGQVESIPHARETAQKILSAVYKTRQSFGAAYIAQVLTGSHDKKILQNGHDSLSVYDLLGDYSQHQVHDWIQQLEGQRFLVRNGRDFPTIQITRDGFTLLAPEKFAKTPEDVPVFLVETRKKATPSQRNPINVPKMSTEDLVLFEALRKKRAALAAKNGIPAFVVFGDRSLQEMARKRPMDADSFLEIFGVGQSKLVKFGQPMMAIIHQFVNQTEVDA